MSPQSARKTGALFLDRDGVINVDRGYVHRADQFEFVHGIFELTRFAVQELRWPVIVITNQAGIGRGFFDEESYLALTEWMCERFRAENAPLTKVYHCPFHPEYGVGAFRRDHEWRKPRPGMVVQAAAEFDLDLSRSVLIGDKMIDIEAAAAAGIPLRIRVDPAGAAPDPAGPLHRVVRNLGEALALLRSQYAR